MIRTIKIALKALLVIATIVVCFLFSFLFVVYQPCNYDKRPANVPKTAIWDGFCPNGVWFDLIEIRGDTARFRIFNNYTGKLLNDAEYVSDSCIYYKLSENNWQELVKINDYNDYNIRMERYGKERTYEYCILRCIKTIYRAQSYPTD